MHGRLRIAAEIGLLGLLSLALLLLFGLSGLRRELAPPASPGSGAGLPAAPIAEAEAPARPLITAAAATPTPEPLANPVEPTSDPRRVGIVVGHWQYDTGAICDDGLREVDVTTDVSQRVQALLEQRGYQVDLLPEHDPDVPAPPMQNYRAAALVSIHADSCDVPGASGFKVARWRYSNLAETDDRLVDCLYDRYGAATLLPRHDDSITIDMWNYYAFREIALETPAAIIELGFLLDDRAAMDGLRYEMARGVAEGIVCFLEGGG